jgi:hypothetical protein
MPAPGVFLGCTVNHPPSLREKMRTEKGIRLASAEGVIGLDATTY